MTRRPKPPARPKSPRKRASTHVEQTKAWPSRHIPLTLVDADSVGLGLTTAEIARDLQVYAASQHKRDRCHAQTVQRYARQVSENLNGSQATSTWTEKPAANATLTEVTLAEPTTSENTLSENSLTDSGV